MARTKTLAATSTVTRDAADILTAKLNEIEGISFVRDAWVNKAPDDYGVVELTGQSMALWADDRMLEQVFRLTVHLYVSGGGDHWIKAVQDKLLEVVDGYSLPKHEYAFDINRYHWMWTVNMIGPMQWEEAGEVSG